MITLVLDRYVNTKVEIFMCNHKKQHFCRIVFICNHANFHSREMFVLNVIVCD